MEVSRRWLGSQEWELRLPNVLAHALYLGFGLVVLASARNVPSMLLGFVVLNLNPFLLDFFGLARGYGLASGLSMAALFFLYEASRRPELQRVAVLLLLSLTCISLADLSNFTWLNLHLAVFAASMLALLLDRERFALRLDRARLAVAAVLSLANFWFVYRLVLRIWRLKTSGELYGRGKSGFFMDTLGSMVDSYFYTQSYSESIRQGVRLLLVAGFFIAIAVISYSTWKNLRITFSTILLLMLILAIAAPVLEHHILGVEYPLERLTLYYMPLLGLLTMTVVDEILSKPPRALRVIGQACCTALLVAMVLHFSRTANLHSTLTWSYDADTKSAVLDLERYFDTTGTNKINVGNNGNFEPAINFYRKTRFFTWLNPATRDWLLQQDNDAVICYPEDLPNRDNYTALKRYPGGTVLYRVAKKTVDFQLHQPDHY